MWASPTSGLNRTLAGTRKWPPWTCSRRGASMHRLRLGSQRLYLIQCWRYMYIVGGRCMWIGSSTAVVKIVCSVIWNHYYNHSYYPLIYSKPAGCLALSMLSGHQFWSTLLRCMRAMLPCWLCLLSGAHNNVRSSCYYIWLHGISPFNAVLCGDAN